ncbi:MAG TPA: SIR2 family protein [Caulobacteraceae bacterium]|nr:SIR2 family protein [Caulobacteraceae bacterium]
MSSTLKRYYLDDDKLAQLAWLEFVRAMRTGRLIAFVGSMATEAFGYGDRSDLREEFFRLAREFVEDFKAGKWRPSDPAAALAAEAQIRIVQDGVRPPKPVITDTVAMSLIEEVFCREEIGASRQDLGDRPTHKWPLDHFESPVEYLSYQFAVLYRRLSEGRTPKARLSEMDVPKILFDNLDIHRFATTNYDFEIERKTMLRDHPDFCAGSLTSAFESLWSLRERSSVSHDTEEFDWDLGSGRIRRVLTHGKAAESDLLNRERIDRLIEFAVGADDVDSHVMHLHGRACNWRSMIVTHRDYDNLYRRNDLNRMPFEFARRLMMGGNPILFVGLGMTEEDVNREFREFVSNNPYHRVAPAFLLWSSIPGALSPEDKRLKRLDWLHRLGVLTIFDDDVKYTRAQEALRARAVARRDKIAVAGATEQEDNLEALALSVRAVATRLSEVAREERVGERWRLTNAELQPASKRYPLILWAREDWTPGAGCDRRLVAAVRDELDDESSILAVLGSSGSGKGQAALDLANHIGQDMKRECLLINGGFCFDTDTLLTEVRDFLGKPPGPVGDASAQDAAPRSRHQVFEAWLEPGLRGHPIYIVINGVERFFSVTGLPLSAELDELLRMKLPGVRWVLFGTERIRRYVAKDLGAKPREFTGFCERRPSFDGRPEHIPFRQMAKIAAAVARTANPRTLSPGDWRNIEAESRRFIALSAARISGDSQGLREVFYSWALDDDVLSSLSPKSSGSLRQDFVKRTHMVLRTLAFFGLPVEASVLSAAPAIKSATLTDWDLEGLLERLVAVGLVLKLSGHGAYDQGGEGIGPPRYALHRSLLTEMRRRFGIPLSEAKLSTAFNMSLYVAQPVDGYIPEPAIHDELGTLVDVLIGVYRETPTDSGAAEKLDTAAIGAGIDARDFRQMLDAAGRVAQACVSRPDSDIERLRIHQLCGRESVQRLRAALAVIRGYYSTTGILTLDTGDRLIREDRDGILREHAERLDRLIDAYAKMDLARSHMREAVSRYCSEGTFRKLYGRGEPFHADELVWLHNERGVVCLAMGDLYEAKAAFERAFRVNQAQVEFDDRAHNWRRIRLNQLVVEVEMGDIGLTRRMAEEIIAVSKKNKALLESRLATAIATGFLAWCSHLQGEFDRAQRFYKTAISGLKDLEETRAQAFFERLRVDALEPAKNHEAGRSPIQKALDLAQSTRQMDLVYRIQISLASAYFFGPESTPRDRQRANRLLDEALQYALQADVHRVRCEASMTIARIRHATGDYEGSLRFASDALMVATRYGMELRKIALRTDIARTMAARGHPVTAQKLAQTAVRAASRQRFQTALDRAERVLIDIPQISAAIGVSDSSGRRNF